MQNQTVINVKTEVYEGPLELLYDLIIKNKIDIYDIPISLLADRYIEEIESFTKKDMESMSEFVSMAATLLQIKSKMLLPAKKDEEEADPRSELVDRLLEYKLYKETAELFKIREPLAGMVFYKPPDPILAQMAIIKQKPRINDILDGLTLGTLYNAFLETLNRRELMTDKIRSGFNSVQKDLYTIGEKIFHIKNLLSGNKTIRFKDIFTQTATKIEKIVTFLALLELIKANSICINQNNLFGDIEISASNNDSNND